MRWALTGLRWSAAAAVLAGMTAILRSMAWSDLWAALVKVPLLLLLLAAVLNLVNLAAKGVCWWILLAKRPGLSLGAVVRYSAGAAALSSLVPLRAGEALRLGLLRTHHGVAVKELLAVAVAEKLLDVAALAVLMTPWLLAGELPQALEPWRPTLVGGVGAVLAAMALWLMAGASGRRVAVAPARAWTKQLLSLSSFFTSSSLWAALGVLLIGWAADLWLAQLILEAVGLGGAWSTALAVLVALNAAIALPSTPGQVGALELGAAGALTWMGAETAPAMAFALVYHAVQLLPLWAYFILDGCFFWRMTRPKEFGSESPARTSKRARRMDIF